MMDRISGSPTSAQCLCGAVVLELRGTPIGSFTCYCDTCQEGSRRIEALPDAPRVREPYGGTEYVLYRKDRVTFRKGQERVKSYKLEQHPKTNRLVATCCNSAMMMSFDDARHWIPVYRARFGTNAPPVEMRVCTRFARTGESLPGDIPSHRDYAPALMLRLLTSRLAMLVGQ